MLNKLLPAFFICLVFITCKKEPNFDVSKASISNNITATKQPPLVAQTSTKSFTVLNAGSGKKLAYLLTPGDDTKNRFTQSPLFLKDIVINFYGKTIIATNLKDSTVKWKTDVTPYNIDYIKTHTTYPIVEGNLLAFVLYVQNNAAVTGIYCINILTGKLVWFNKKFAVSDKTIPTYAKGLLLVNGSSYLFNGYFFALDINTGKIKWVAPDGFSTVTPACTDSDYVYYTKANNTGGQKIDTLFARNISDGSIHWFKVVFNANDDCTAFVDKDQLYTNYSYTLFCFNKKTSALKWKFKVDQNKVLGFSAINVDDNIVYISTYGYAGGVLYALNAKNGQEVWSQSITAEAYLTPPDGAVILNNTVYDRQSPDYITAYNKLTGSIIWKTQLNNRDESDPEWAPSYVDQNGKMFYSPQSGMR